MNNYTTARLPLRQSENSWLLKQLIEAPEPSVNERFDEAPFDNALFDSEATAK